MGEALTAAAKARGAPSPSYLLIVATLDRLLAAGVAAGAIRSDISADDLMFPIAGLWHVPPSDDWQAQTERLLGLLMDGLRAGAAAPSAR
jgi:hypothetical protein